MQATPMTSRRTADVGDTTSRPAFEALADTADAAVERWRRQRDEVETRRRAYHQALATERAMRRELAMVTQLLSACAGDPDASDDRVVPEPTGNGHEPATPRASRPPPADATAADLAVFLLGPFQIYRSGQAVDSWPGTRSSRIVRYVAAHRGHPVAREVLIDQFWPDADVETGRRNLHQAIYQIRCALRRDDERPCIAYCNEAYSLDGKLTVWCDADAFEAHLKAGRDAEREGRHDDAIAELTASDRLYVGDYLEDTPYEEWAFAERSRLRLAHLAARNRLADLFAETGDFDAALDLTQLLLNDDPGDEVAHRRALRCYAATGRRHLVAGQYGACIDALERLYGVEPSPETAGLFRELTDRPAPPPTGGTITLGGRATGRGTATESRAASRSPTP